MHRQDGVHLPDSTQPLSTDMNQIGPFRLAQATLFRGQWRLGAAWCPRARAPDPLGDAPGVRSEAVCDQCHTTRERTPGSRVHVGEETLCVCQPSTRRAPVTQDVAAASPGRRGHAPAFQDTPLPGTTDATPSDTQGESGGGRWAHGPAPLRLGPLLCITSWGLPSDRSLLTGLALPVTHVWVTTDMLFARGQCHQKQAPLILKSTQAPLLLAVGWPLGAQGGPTEPSWQRARWQQPTEAQEMPPVRPPRHRFAGLILTALIHDHQMSLTSFEG